MEKFHIEDGYLKIGNPIERGPLYVSNIIQDYNIMNSKSKEITQALDMKIKTTIDHKYCAVYSPNYLYCDFYEQLEPEIYMPIVKSQNDPLYIRKPRTEYKFTLKRNTHRVNDFIVEFVTHPITKEIVVIFNAIHGRLSIYNMKGELLNTEKSENKFFKRLEMINNKYMIGHCWVWGSMDIDVLYNIHDLITIPNYSPILIWAEEDYTIYEIIGDKIKIIELEEVAIVNEFDPKYHHIKSECIYTLDEIHDKKVSSH